MFIYIFILGGLDPQLGGCHQVANHSTAPVRHAAYYAERADSCGAWHCQKCWPPAWSRPAHWSVRLRCAAVAQSLDDHRRRDWQMVGWCHRSAIGYTFHLGCSDRDDLVSGFGQSSSSGRCHCWCFAGAEVLHAYSCCCCDHYIWASSVDR